MSTAPLTSDSKRSRKVIVLGGGLAGIAAAARLAQQGYAVNLVEAGSRLGGRATSFEDPDSELMVDNCV